MKPALKKYLVTIIMVFVLVGIGYQLWSFYLLGGWTRDGKIRVNVMQVAAQVSGQLVRLPISDNQLVKRGDLLFGIDPIDYEINLKNAKAQLAQLRVRQEQAHMQFDRRNSLKEVAAISKENLEEVKFNLDLLNDQVEQAQIMVEKAELELSRTKVYAEANGYITNMNIHQGNFIPAGQPLFALVDKDSFYVVGYFEETKLKHIAIGRKVALIPYNGMAKMHGHIVGYGRAIIDQSSQTGEQLLQSVQPAYPWVTLAQRIPVKIALDAEDLKSRELIAGTTVTVIILQDQ